MGQAERLEGMALLMSAPTYDPSVGKTMHFDIHQARRGPKQRRFDEQ